MEDMKIYLFAQALDNNSSDDWYEYTSSSIEKITKENDQSWVNNLIFELTDKGERENYHNVECYYKLNSNEFFDFMLLIENQQEDNIGRKSKTALIVKGYKGALLDLEEILTSFWIKTNRNSSISGMLAEQCQDVLKIIKKKKKRKYLTPLILVSLSIILVIFFQKLSKG